ncbi:hypothetical protein [Lutimonas zeaxanthinifaciens]|uniref:hypothetical protein n=1 Tax=Lutimonas zeaxanthinifaciens TaxID=3060215 RepID=UPI00265CB644|nr:hypothetical protein [Lutimonas sp. YSD2104]WKK66703.1 hypothetical protein QZH61_03570 [Lutimonas sp. YSD2104]
MQKLTPLLICLILFLACKKEKTAPTGQDKKNEKILLTASGKEIRVYYNAAENGLTTVKIVPVDFQNTSDTLSLSDIDPIQNLLLHDLDNNGFDELYIITTSSGSGSYATIYGFASNKDLSLSPVYFPEIVEDDLSLGGDYQGYMGHDSIYFENRSLIRKFPVYKEGDANCCPTGGDKTLRYKLIPGEASWILTLDK